MKKPLAVIFLSVANLLSAQTTSSQQTVVSATSVAQAKLQAFVGSLSDFAAQDFTDGEAILEQANVQPAATPSGNKESASDLIKVAQYFQNTGNPGLAYAVAKLALGHLVLADQAYTAASLAPEVANEKELQGYLYQHYFGDRPTAEKYYSAAVSLSPNTTSLAAAALLRLQQIDASEAQKQAYAAANQ